MANVTGQSSAESGVQHINPDGLPHNKAYTNVITVTGPVKTVYIGGQDAVDASGAIVAGDITVQTEQVLKNVQTALAAGGASLAHIIKCNVYVVQGQPLYPAFLAFQRLWADRPNPPTITVLTVVGLARPEFLLEMDAIAVVPLTV